MLITIIEKIERTVNTVRDVIFDIYFGVRLGLHLTFRDIDKCLDDLERYEAYDLKHYDEWNWQDVNNMLETIDYITSAVSGYGFEGYLLKQIYKLDAMERMKERYMDLSA